MKYPQILRDLFGLDRRDGHTPSAQPTRAGAAAGGMPPPAPAGKGGRERFNERLRALAAAGEGGAAPLVTGRLQVVAFAALRARFGEDWPRLAAKAHGHIQRLLERRLTAVDVYERIGEDGYLILFANLSRAEAALKAHALAREIMIRLAGNLPGAGKDAVEASVRELSPGALGPAPDLEALAAAFEAADGAEGGGAGGDTGGGARVGEPSLAGADCLRTSYLPVWSRRGRAIVLYLCAPMGGGPQAEKLYPREGGVPTYELDCAVLRAVLDDLTASWRAGHAALVVAPVHWATLGVLHRRPEYLELCRGLPPDPASRLGFAIYGMPAGIWQAHATPHLALLAPFSRYLAAHVAPEPSWPQHFVGLGVQALTFDAADFDPADGDRCRRVEAFVRRAHDRGLAVGALGVGSRAGAEALLALEVDLLAGGAVAPPVDTPGAAYPVELAA